MRRSSWRLVQSGGSDATMRSKSSASGTRRTLALPTIEDMSATVTRDEHDLLHESVGLVDRSYRGKLLLRGAEAAEFLQGQVTNDVEALAPGTGCYAALLTHKGKM